MAVAALLAACGGESSSDANQPAGTYDVRVTDASFPTEQRLGQTSLMELAVRNTGKKALPSLAVTISIAGKEGQDSALPFGVRDPQTGLAQPDRPVWVLAAGYPRLAGSSDPGGGTTSNRKTFSFGPLKPGATTEAVWKLSAVKAGQLHRALQGRRRSQRHRQGPDQRRRRRRLLRDRNLRRAARTPKSPTDGEVVEKAKQRQRPEPGE